MECYNKKIDDYSRRTFLKKSSIAISLAINGATFSPLVNALAFATPSNSLSIIHSFVKGYKGYLHNPSIDGYMLPGGRPYDPATGRFMTPDSWSPFGPAGINRYSYCNSDPINYLDPNGHISTWQWIGIGLASLIFIGAAMSLVGLVVPVVTGAAITSATVTGITASVLSMSASIVGVTGIGISESDPEAAAVLGWVSLGLGIGNTSFGVLSGGLRTVSNLSITRPTLAQISKHFVSTGAKSVPKLGLAGLGMNATGRTLQTIGHATHNKTLKTVGTGLVMAGGVIGGALSVRGAYMAGIPALAGSQAPMASLNSL